MKKFIAILTCLVLLFSLTSPVLAVFETSSCALNASATRLKRGDTFTITATLTNTDDIGMGAVALLYDNAVFEVVSGACLVQAPAGLMLFPVVLAEEGIGSFTFYSMEGESTAVVTGDIFSFEVKVKDDAPFGTFEIGNETAIGVDTSTMLSNSTGVSITVECDHIMEENWVQDDTQNHKKSCTVPGCEYKITEAHSFTVIETGSPNDNTYTVTYTCACGYSYEEKEPRIFADTKHTAAGGRVAVNISLANNPGIASATLKVQYDTTALTLIGVKDLGKLGTQVHKPEFTSPYTLSWVNDTATENFTYNGAVVTLVFEVAEDAAFGDYPIEISYDNSNYDIYNVDAEAVKFLVANGFVTVGEAEDADVLYGDVNNDGDVNNLDRNILTRYLGKWDGYGEDIINKAASDVNNDGDVNNLDRNILTRHLGKWDGYETLPYAN